MFYFQAYLYNTFVKPYSMFHVSLFAYKSLIIRNNET